MTRLSPTPLPPGSVIGIVGGGQLGRMTALAAAQLGYASHIYCPDADSPAFEVARHVTVAPYDDQAALTGFAQRVDVITFEFENIPVAPIHALSSSHLVRPGVHCLEVAQHRIKEKDFLNAIGVATADYRAIEDLAALRQAATAFGGFGVLKTARMGYDGKGQVMVTPKTDLAAAFAQLDGALAIFESLVPFEREISVVIARSPDGSTRVYDVVENQHRHHILDRTIAPAAIAPDTAATAQRIAHHIVHELDLVGLLAVEMFLSNDGQVRVNELAPRPHNSGHWTLDACVTSQFEQFVRAICGLPLGDPSRHSNAEMTNLLGDDVNCWQDILAEDGAKLHLYGKKQPRPGRKMGHVTRLLPKR